MLIVIKTHASHACAQGRKHTSIVVYEFDLWEGEGVVEGHEDGWLHHDVNHVHGCVPKEEGGCVKPCRHTYNVGVCTQSQGALNAEPSCASHASVPFGRSLPQSETGNKSGSVIVACAGSKGTSAAGMQKGPWRNRVLLQGMRHSADFATLSVASQWVRCPLLRKTTTADSSVAAVYKVFIDGRAVRQHLS